MNSINNYYNRMNKQIRKFAILSVVSTGMTIGIYLSVKKIIEIIEDKRLARFYEDEIEKIFEEKEKMDFYENEFIKQEKKEQEDLEKAVDEFNSKRLKREECPNCSHYK